MTFYRFRVIEPSTRHQMWECGPVAWDMGLHTAQGFYAYGGVGADAENPYVIQHREDRAGAEWAAWDPLRPGVRA